MADDFWSNYGSPAKLPPTGGSVPVPQPSKLDTLNSAINLAKNAYNFVRGIFDGGANNMQACPGQWDTTQVAYALANASSGELASLQRAYGLANPNEQWRDDPFYIAWSAAGGSDCAAKSVNGQNWKGSFDLFMQTKLMDLGATPYAPGTTPPTTTSGSLGRTASLGDEIDKIWEALKQTGANVFRSTVSGAVAGAQTSTQGAATGSSVGNLGNLVPLLAIGAIGVAGYLLLRKK